MRTNSLGPVIPTESARTIGARCIPIPTDYVFNGKILGELEENAEVGPSDGYSQSELGGKYGIYRVMNAENVGKSGTNRYILRSSWLFRLGCSSLVKTMWKLMLENTELYVVNDQYGNLIYGEKLAQFVANMLTLSTSDLIRFDIGYFVKKSDNLIRICARDLANDVGFGTIDFRWEGASDDDQRISTCSETSEEFCSVYGSTNRERYSIA